MLASLAQLGGFMHPADVPTLEEILEDFDLQDYLEPAKFAELLDMLKLRETILIADLTT